MKRPDLIPTTLHGKLGRLVEETAEMLLALGKYQRFGDFAVDETTGIKYNNEADLHTELHDLRHAIDEVLSHNKPEREYANALRSKVGSAGSRDAD